MTTWSSASSPASVRRGGREGIKLEPRVPITADGPKPMSSYPFEEALL